MGSFDELSVRTRFRTPSRLLDGASVETLIAAGGYTHPLFTDPVSAERSAFGKRPLPGQAILLVMGGLVEQAGRLDGTVIALLGFDDVRFEKPAFEGDEIGVDVEVVAKEEPRSDRGVLVMEWRCFRGDEVLVRARARMLLSR